MEVAILIAIFVAAIFWACMRYAARANAAPAKKHDVAFSDGWSPMSSSDSHCDTGDGGGGGGD